MDEQEKRAPKLSSAPAVAAAKREVDELGDQRDRAAGSLAAALAESDAASRKADAAASNPSAGLDELAAARAAADEAYSRLRGLGDVAWVDADGRAAAEAARLRRVRDDLGDRLSAAVLAGARAVSRDATGAAVAPTAASLAAAGEVAANAEKALSPLAPYAGAGAAGAAVDEASKDVAGLRESLRRAREEFDARRSLADNVATAASARAALEDFARRFPDSPASRDFARAAASADLYAGVEAWHAAAAPWAADPAPAGERQADQRLEAVRAFLRDHPTSPLGPRAQAYADYLQQAAAAMAVQNTWQQGMADLISSPLLSDLKYLEASDGTRYYVLGDPVLRTQQVNDHTTWWLQAMDPQNLTRHKSVMVGPPRTLLGEKPTPAPHTLFVQGLAEQLKTVDAANWETFGVDLVDSIVAQAGIDPVVKSILLREAVRATAKADGWAVGDVYDKALDGLVRQQLDGVVWYDPEHPVSAAMVANLKRIIDSVPKAADVRRAIRARRAELLGTLDPPFSGDGSAAEGRRREVGRPIRRPPPAGSVALAIVPPPAGAPAAVAAPAAVTPAVTATPAPASQPSSAPAEPDAPPAPSAPPVVLNPATFVSVAEWKDHGLVVDDAAAADLPQGTIVLFKQPDRVK